MVNHAAALDRWFEVTAFRVGEPGQNRVAALFEDITLRKKAELVLQQNAERLRFLDELNRETARVQEPDAILAVATRMMGQHLGVSVCAYADMDADEDAFTIQGDWSAPGSSSIVGHYSLKDFGQKAVAELGAGRPLILKNIAAELPAHEAATFAAIGIAATVCMPLVREGRLTALMAIHDKAPRDWTAGELAMIGEMTERSWAHIERARTMAVVKASENQFRTMAQAMPNHVWTASPDGLLDWFNQQVYDFIAQAFFHQKDAAFDADDRQDANCFLLAVESIVRGGRECRHQHDSQQRRDRRQQCTDGKQFLHGRSPFLSSAILTAAECRKA